jgi:branched-chain amino acid transport system permease protein
MDEAGFPPSKGIGISKVSVRAYSLMVTGNTLLELVVDGLARGLFLTLLGVGITLVFGLGGVLNLAIGTFAVGSVLVATTAIAAGVSVPIAIAFGVLAVGVFSLVVDQTLLEQVYKSDGEERILLGIFVMLGLAILLEGALTNYYESRYSLPVDMPSVTLGEITIVGSSLFVIVVSVVILIGLYVFLRRTFLGRATRTVFQDEVGAQLVGVDPRRIRTLIFVLSSVIAAVAGITAAVSGAISVSSGFRFSIIAVIVSIVGGVRSLEGAVVAGISLGIVTTYANFFIGSYIATLILFGAAVTILIVNPGVFRS